MRTRKGYADGPCGQVHYQVLGEGLPLLLCHQSPSSSEMFRAAYPLLATAGIQAVGVDTPGYGRSDPPPVMPTIRDYGDAVLAVMDHLSLSSASVLGHHTGASVAAELAAAQPQRIDRVILNGPPVLTQEERESLRQTLTSAPPPAPRADGSHLQAIWDRRLQFTPGWSHLGAMHLGVIQMLIAGGRAQDGFCAAFAHDITTALRRISQPAMILTNTGDDLYEASRRARELRPDFHYVELAGGTHDIVDEQPEAWSTAVVAFVLAKYPARWR